MTDSLLRQIALVSESSEINSGDVSRVSAALQKQAVRDLVQFWSLKATVDTFPRLEDVPIGYWPIMVMDNINEPGAAGIHSDDHGQPFALVTASDRLDVWSLTASHEMIEMLIDPFGDRLVASDSPKEDQGRVEILVEACDPSEAAEFGYTINGILVSDFYTPRFFDPIEAPAVRYSFTGAIQQPRQVLRGGYLSWHDPISDEWWQEIWFGGSAPTFRNLGRLSARDGSFRSQIDRLTTQATSDAQAGGLRAARAGGLAANSIEHGTVARAANLRRQIDALVGGSQPRQGASSRRAKAPQKAKHDQHDSEADRFSGAAGSNGSASVQGLRVAPSLWSHS